MKKLMLCGSIALLVAGCIPSLNPFYTAKDLVFAPELVGEWQARNESDQPAQWQFERLEDKAYKLTVTEDKGKKGEFTAHLFKIGKAQFLDIVPSKCDYDSNQAALIASAMFPGHLLLRVGQIGPELRMAPFDYDWLKKYLDENPKAIAHHEESDSVVLTAGTADLQRFVLAHLAEGQLFKPESVLVRTGATGSKIDAR
ncbi:MAG: hypothetical protein ACLQVY_31085 [Limisphaerales bacterium]